MIAEKYSLTLKVTNEQSMYDQVYMTVTSIQSSQDLIQNKYFLTDYEIARTTSTVTCHSRHNLSHER